MDSTMKSYPRSSVLVATDSACNYQRAAILGNDNTIPRNNG